MAAYAAVNSRLETPFVIPPSAVAALTSPSVKVVIPNFFA